jgi:hypothetical protein
MNQIFIESGLVLTLVAAPFIVPNNQMYKRTFNNVDTVFVPFFDYLPT